jgi:multidrug transporter EmrE-like cation transporter
MLNTAGLLLLRSALRRAGQEDVLEALVTPRFVGGFTLYGLGFLIWLLSLRQYEISLIYPLFVGVACAALVASAVVLLDESLTGSRAAGTLFVVSGIALLSR